MARYSAPRRGMFAALDVRTNRIAWRQQWVDQCYSGSTMTADDLRDVAAYVELARD